MPRMLLYRLRPDGRYAVRTESASVLRVLESDPFTVEPSEWDLGRPIEEGDTDLLAPVAPGKIVGVGRNYRAHAEELGHAVPEEPLLFLKSPGAVVGTLEPVLLPPESEQVDFEGEVAVVLRRRLQRADREAAADAVLGATAALDVTARDLQRRDATFARAKSFDTFCPLGPAIRVGADLHRLSMETRLNGEVRQRATTAEMLWTIPELLAFISGMMTLEPGDVVLTGTPAGVGPLASGDVVEVEMAGVGVLRNPVAARAP